MSSSLWDAKECRVALKHTKPITAMDIICIVLILRGGASQMVLVIKNPPANARDRRDLGSIPGLGSSPGGGPGNPLQYSCLEKSMDRGAWWAIIHRITQSQIQVKQLSTHACFIKGSKCLWTWEQHLVIWGRGKQNMVGPRIRAWRMVSHDFCLPSFCFAEMGRIRQHIQTRKGSWRWCGLEGNEKQSVTGVGCWSRSLDAVH